MTTSGAVKIRDYGMLNLANVLAKENYLYLDEIKPPDIIFPGGYDNDYVALLGKQIGTDAGRSVHEVKGYVNHVMKVYHGSHRPNRFEFLVHNALSSMYADECQLFGALECSRSGKYLVMERLNDLPQNFRGSRPEFPYWLVDISDARLGVTAEDRVKIRSYSEIRLGDVLAKAHLRKR